jgi:hypothetical protein
MKTDKKALLIFLILSALFYAAAIIWSQAWIEKTSITSLPNTKILQLARFFWTISPSFDENRKIEQTLKISWLTAATKINKNEKKQVDSIIETLADEFNFVAKRVEINGESLHKEIQFKAATQLLTYLNRVEFYQKFENLQLEVAISEFALRAKAFGPLEQENWYRENMIRSALNKDSRNYQKNMADLEDLYKTYGPEIPQKFKQAAIYFYAGTLFCIMNDEISATQPLAMAAKYFSDFPVLATDLFYQDLNVLLLGKGMQTSPRCNEMLTKVINSGLRK